MNNIQEGLPYQNQTDKQDSVDTSLMEALSKLVKQDREKGKTAWNIGQLLSKMRKQILNKTSTEQNNESIEQEFGLSSTQIEQINSEEQFEDFVAKNFGVSKNQVERWMGIYNSINDSNLITKKMGIGHLEQVIRLKDKNAIEEVLKILAELEAKQKDEKDLPYTEKIIAEVVTDYKEQLKKQSSAKQSNSLFDLNFENNNNQQSSQNNFSLKDYFNLKISDHENRNKLPQDSIRKDIWGTDIETDKFPEIRYLYAKKPIDEQGLVGFFCTIFPLIKNRNLTIESEDFLGILKISKTKQLQFSKIKGIRQRFPDAQIEFEIRDKKISNSCKTTELNIEFEFRSSNYITHNHYKAKDTCDLIICWQHSKDDENRWNNWKKYYYDNKSKPLPFIFSMEDLLECGYINLINLNPMENK